MSPIRDMAEKFFVACETGEGWDGCQVYCHADATFSSQAGALEGVDTLQGYTDWMKGLLTPLPDGKYELVHSRSTMRGRAWPLMSCSGEPTLARAVRCRLQERRWKQTMSTSWIRRRSHPPHDEDLGRWDQPEAARVGVANS